MSGDTVKVRLVDIAHARSGDKGDTANVGVIAYEERWYPLLAQHLSRDAVTRHFGANIDGPVERAMQEEVERPEIRELEALDGGGTLSLKTDAQGKVFSTALLRMVLDVPRAEAERLGLPVKA